PKNKIVAGFIGSPEMNFVAGSVKRGDTLSFSAPQFSLRLPDRYVGALDSYVGRRVILGIRPEHIEIAKSAFFLETIEAKVDVVEPIGAETFVLAHVSGNLTLTVKHPGMGMFPIDSIIHLRPLPGEIHFFDEQTEERIVPLL
ncbi:MAG TPA: TOBE domain-containing protein, partial [Candidatus Hodarchaeales archaeon]|nr:TOBE domain-containing protein [Candidatus Hodarchaeales archaeon]